MNDMEKPGAIGLTKLLWEFCELVLAICFARIFAPKASLLQDAGATRIAAPAFHVAWTYVTSRGELHSTCIEEIASDVLYDRAYPQIEGGVHAFVRAYLDDPESVLVLQGPPGTGKTRLIRAILGEMSRRKGEPARALYSGDMNALMSDEIFARFVSGYEDAFVVEDADPLLQPRADGNLHLHRFLAIADGVVRARGRKLIFSTNLPNVGHLDDALVRPGRCFARLQLRALTGDEARALVEEIAGDDGDWLQHALLALGADEGRRRSVAEVYQALR
jgi:hypothetical protein